jgi:hypothetical protein
MLSEPVSQPSAWHGLARHVIIASMPTLQSRLTPDAQAAWMDERSCRLEIPAGPAGQYRLAQLDDYQDLPRAAFPHQPPFILELQARASGRQHPGTWGFGLWNDPFSLGRLGGAGPLRLPCLPDAAWFFFAASPNHLSIRDDQPGSSWLAMTFRSPSRPAAWIACGGLLAPLLLTRLTARWLRRLARRAIHQESWTLPVDPTEWHTYRIEWQSDEVLFLVDGQNLFESSHAPRGRLGLVIWVDNQYAAWTPEGSLGWGLLENSTPAWVEIRALNLIRSGSTRS